MKGEITDEMALEFPPYEVEELTKEELLGDTVLDYLTTLEDSVGKILAIERVKDRAKELHITSAFNKALKQRDKEISISKRVTEKSDKPIFFNGLEKPEYNTSKYELDESGRIYKIIPDVGRVLVCYHPIVPVEKYTNIEDGSTKIKLAFCKKGVWKTLIVDKETIASNQKIVNLARYDIEVTSETSKFLVEYLSEILKMNEDKINETISISRFGWFKDVLIPYSDKLQIDNEKDIPNLKEQFGERGKLEDWIDFFRERRKYNNISRITMAASVASILLKELKQNGFTLHIFGESEYGKTVASMVAQSIFGNPAQDGNGIGINFNFTSVGLEYKLNLYNNLPLFINEMQHQKDAKDYDKILFLVSEGKGKARGTKNGGSAKLTSWNNVVITNGEKNIIKDNSNAGAYNRCIACEITNYSFEELSLVAEFVKDNYGTPIREILKNLDKFDCKKIYNDFLDQMKNNETTNKQKILVAILLTADKIATDVLFKDNYYLTVKDFEDKTVKKSQVVVEERAYEVVKDWIVSEKRHFLMQDEDGVDIYEIKVEIYGKEMQYNYIAIIPSVLKRVLEENGYDFNEVLKAWNRKDYIKHEASRNTLLVRINKARTRCVVLDMKKDSETEITSAEEILLPF